jgi:hypothetical protein
VKVAAATATTHNPFDESHTGELLAGKPPEQFLWGGAGNGPRPFRYRASPLPDNPKFAVGQRYGRMAPEQSMHADGCRMQPR